MEIITPEMIETLSNENKRKFEGLLPEIVKRLILCGSNDISRIRIPSNDGVWAPGFDGVVDCSYNNAYIREGLSVWEFGTSRDSLKKINSDYCKRTKDPLGMDIKDTTFYLVFPKIWAFDNQDESITKWESEHSDWKSVRVYDACILCQWINSEPSVCAWLVEEIFNVKIDFSTVQRAWEEFSSMTNPSLTNALFLRGRDAEINDFQRSFSNHIIRIKGDTFYDSYGFALAAIIEEENIRDSCIVINNDETFRVLSSFCINKLFLMNYGFDGITSDKNKIIICFNKEATGINPDVELRQMSKSDFDVCLKEMGCDETQINEAYAFTHGNLCSLIRRIPGNFVQQIPDWANEEDIHLLYPLLFLRNINRDTDREIVEKLSGVSYESVEDKYNRWCMIQDNPVKQVNNYYVLVNYEETFRTLTPSIFDCAFERLETFVLNGLESIAKSDGTETDYDNAFRNERTCCNIFLNFAYYSYNKESSQRLYSTIERIVIYLLHPNTQQIISNNLSVLAEAAPPIVLKFIQDDVASKSGVILDLFQNSSSGLYVGLLSAIDELVANPETAINTCKLLFELTEKEYKYQLTNSPRESLLMALCLWNNYGGLLLEEKLNLISYFFGKNPLMMASLSLELIKKESIFISSRLGAKKRAKIEELSQEKYFAAIEEISNKAYKIFIDKRDAKSIEKILSSYYMFKPETLSFYLDAFDISSYDISDVLDLNFSLRQTLFHIIKYKRDEHAAYISMFKSWIDKSTYSDSPLDSIWMFRNVYDFPSEDVADLSYDEEQTEIKQKRIEQISNILKCEDDSVINKFFVFLNDESYYGVLCAKSEYNNSKQHLGQLIYRNNKLRILAGYIDGIDKDSALSLIKMATAKEREWLLKSIRRKDFVESDLDESLLMMYWSTKEMHEYDCSEYKKLLKHNPFGLINYCFINIKNINFDIVYEVLSRIVDMDNNQLPWRNYEYEISEIIKAISAGYYSRQWGELCLKLYEHNLIKSIPDAVEKMFFVSPDLFVDFLKAKNRYFEIMFNFILPEDAYSDYETLRSFVNCLIEHDYKPIVGNILGRSKNGIDGIFPHEYVRNILEEYSDDALDSEVHIGKYNSRGVRSISDGTDMKKIAMRYREDAKKISIFYPRSSAILISIANAYEHEADGDYLYSETGIM